MSGRACNLARSGVRRRAVTGAVALVAYAAAAVVLRERLPAPWGRLALLPVAFFGFLCVFQAQGGT